MVSSMDISMQGVRTSTFNSVKFQTSRRYTDMHSSFMENTMHWMTHMAESSCRTYSSADFLFRTGGAGGRVMGTHKRST